MPSADRGKEGGKASLGKPKSGFTEYYVLGEVNPVDKTPLLEKGSRFANTKNKAAAQLVFEGTVPSFSTCLFIRSLHINHLCQALQHQFLSTFTSLLFAQHLMSWEI